MDVARARSPPASLGRRPIGPRSPGKPGTFPVKSIIPLDLTARLQEDIANIPRTASPEAVSSLSGSSRPASPASAPVPLRSQTVASSVSSRPQSSEVNGHRRAESARSEASQAHSQQSHGEPVSEPGDAILPDASEDAHPPADTTTRASVSPAPSADMDGPAETGPQADEDEEGTEVLLAASDVPPPPLSAVRSEFPLTATMPPPSEYRAPGAVDESVVPPSPNELSVLYDVLGIDAEVPPPHTIEHEDSPPAALSQSPQMNGTTQINESNDVSEAPVEAEPNVGPAEPSPDSEKARLASANGDSGYVEPPPQFEERLESVDVTNGHTRALSEKSVQANTSSSERPGTPALSTRASTPSLLRVIPKRPPLAPPTSLSFDAEPIKWKAMTLEAAQWTFTSEELQGTVSRAIRQSAAESFIRVISAHTQDVELPQEMERLESLRTTTQAQYRFNMHRRAMLLQSLAALSQSQSDSDDEALYNLTTQLSELTTSCDRLMEILLRVADQKAQIQHLQDLHVASALAMALRKLNASYAKRTTELQETRARNDELRAELEEAWNMAQDMAQEMDDLDNFNLDFTDEEFTPDDDEPSNSALEAEIYSDMDRMSNISSMRDAEVVGITGKAVVAQATVTSLPGADKPGAGDRTSRVIAAKKRSSRASKASLRIPKTPTDGNRERTNRSSIYSIRNRRRSRSKSVRRAERGEGGSKQIPEVPIIRVPDPSRSREGSFLELSQTRPGSPSTAVPVADTPPPLPPKESLDTLRLHMNIAATRSEEVLPMSNPPPSPTLEVPIINLPEQDQQQPTKGPSWVGRRFFARRVHSMQPPIKAADDATDPAQIKRSLSEHKQFDGWPFGTKTQRFSVPVLSVIQPGRQRKSSDSAPVGRQ
ncbi:hypothetical protein L226DRAFT_614254 [Lentinus tigrinus ALCF2SS1-7]|uniref:Uncharacterized protein n=1 Tax=Lentinus tigrinus ALCF2SS1-6 TaxID=1328759 RepID=A0A5C2S7A9_9APHY|nr:hypothetical protein L227DRAFT_612346 [Lentinus tigrinus ALCF2SS1-6]RPD73362.1 hypothetical protein L226DRAFT_614254 [Lentinus tigrinus ALCF2SS1-7]